MNNNKNLLVVDWDFFFQNKLEGDYEKGNDDLLLYDWGHAEKAIYMDGWLWYMRAASFIRNGKGLPDTTGEEVNFWKRFRFSKQCALFISESNVMSIHPAVRIGIKNVWLYDAHHDAGYRGEKSFECIKTGNFNCENWMMAYDYNGCKLHVRYPRWRSSAMEREQPAIKTVDRAVDDGLPLKSVLFHRVHVCRSGAWTPTWLDPKFFKFIESFPRGKAVTIGQPDDMTPREFSEDHFTDELARQAEEEVLFKKSVTK